MSNDESKDVLLTLPVEGLDVMERIAEMYKVTLSDVVLAAFLAVQINLHNGAGATFVEALKAAKAECEESEANG